MPLLKSEQERGLEASLFASDLFSMYQKASSKNNWKIEILNTPRVMLADLKKK